MNLLVITAGCGPGKSGYALRVYHCLKMVKDHVRICLVSTSQTSDPHVAHEFHYRPFADNWKSKIKKLWTYFKTDFSSFQPPFNSPSIEKPDIVQIHTPYFFGLKRNFPNVPTILVEEDVTWNLLKFNMTLGPGIRKMPFKFLIVPWLRWRAKKFEKRALKESDHVFVCSSVDRQEILKELPQLEDRVTVVPNCVDPSHYPPSDQPGETVLFMGSLTYRPNQDAAAIILKELAPRLPEIPFQIIGPGSIPRDHPQNVRFLGYVEEILPHLAKCRMLIVPLRFGSGVRWKILEAMAMQRPVISTTKGAEGLEVTHGENIWLEDDWGLFAQAIVRLWKDNQEAKSIAQGGRRLIETRYDYRIYTPRVLKVYENLLRGSSCKGPSTSKD